MSPEAITAPFWRTALAGTLQKFLSFFAVDEAHLIEEWGSTFRSSFKELFYLRFVLSVPIMALSATAPLSVVSAVTSCLCMSECLVISGSLNRSNPFYAIDSNKSLSSVFYLLCSNLSSTSSLETFPKVLIFCVSEDILNYVQSL